MVTCERQRPKGAIEKAFALLAELQSAGEAVRLSELSRRLDLPKSTAHRTLKILAETGLVTQSGTSYQAVFRQRGGGPGPVGENLFRRLTPFVCDVLVRTGLTASLATLDGTNVVFPYRAFAHDGIHAKSDYSGRASAYSTAAGRMLLAFDPAAARQVAASRSLNRDRVSELTEELTRLARQCYTAKSSGDGVTCIAVPLLGGRGIPPVVLTVRGATGKVDIGRTVYGLQRVAEAAASSVFRTTTAEPELVVRSRPAGAGRALNSGLPAAV
ncbi:transcriptional regulator, IclR family [Lentzea fradiae]|uniref:Transcriptional regulator, IclR family n=1 Tax=Lentzea fradiae TaxID=200378 RepID=A0A1G8CLT9_9PSEU|nr:helix-turn-helix domain-containing protein [Lentzea fradiae]SDH46527.1 transcriptional regulator, IclR family [Lentzea fradiae]